MGSETCCAGAGSPGQLQFPCTFTIAADARTSHKSLSRAFCFWASFTASRVGFSRSGLLRCDQLCFPAVLSLCGRVYQRPGSPRPSRLITFATARGAGAMQACTLLGLAPMGQFSLPVYVAAHRLSHRHQQRLHLAQMLVPLPVLLRAVFLLQTDLLPRLVPLPGPLQRQRQAIMRGRVIRLQPDRRL